MAASSTQLFSLCSYHLYLAAMSTGCHLNSCFPSRATSTQLSGVHGWYPKPSCSSPRATICIQLSWVHGCQ
jgi:hypothetical protein